jgi:hypothetical protein
MSVSKFTKKVVTYLSGETHKNFELERLRSEEKPAPFARKLIKLGLEKLEEDRVLRARGAKTFFSKHQTE